MSHPLVNPSDPPDEQRRKLIEIAEVLMRRVEQAADDRGAAYAQFQRAVLLEDQVRTRTADLERALDLLNQTNAQLAEAKAEAEAARANLASAIETIQDGFALFDAEERLVMANSRYGQPLAELRAQVRPGITFTDYVRMGSRSPELKLNPGETPESWYAWRLRRHADGGDLTLILPLVGDRWMQVSEYHTKDGGMVILHTDLTEVMRLEREERGRLLDDQARMVRATLDHLSQGVAIFDAEARLIGFNTRLSEHLSVPLARLRLGMSFDALFGQAMVGFRTKGASAEEVFDWAARRDPRPPVQFDLLRLTGRPGGDVLTVQGQEMPDGGFVMSFSDVTAERDAQRRLAVANETLERRVAARTEELAAALATAEQASAARARFVAAASHDLLQPLSAAKLFLASLADEALPGRAGDTVGMAQNALSSVEEILSALLEISRLESGRAAADVGAVRLGEMLRQLGAEFAPLAAKKGLRLTVMHSRAVVDSDATYLRRILQNLIANAIRYTETGRVLVGVRHLPGAVRVEVIDTGPGIPETEQRAIFREFHRLNARASASEGMGLGLAIVERACALLGHPLDVRSVPGRGSRFQVTVPLAQGGELRPAEERRDAPAGLEGRIVLLVESDERLRQALVMVMETWGCQVLEAGTAEAAEALLAEIGIMPDRALIDCRLGAGMDGLALADRLVAAHGPLPLRLITADHAEALASAARHHGILRKPIDSEALAKFLRDETG